MLGVALATIAGLRAQSSQPADANLQSELQSLVRSGAKVGAVLGVLEPLHANLPRRVSLPEGADARVRVAEMSARWSGILDVVDSTVISIRSRRAPLCEASLAQRVDAEAIGGNATEVMFAIAKQVDPRLASLGPPGLLSGGGSGPDTSSKLLNETVWLSGGRIRVEDALNQFVTRQDGYGWWVAEKCPPDGVCSCEMGLLTAESVLFSMYDISPRSQGPKR